MAIASVQTMVRRKLPFLTDLDNPTIDEVRIEQCYFLQSQTGKTDLEVEDEVNYTGLQNMLFSDMTAFQMGKNQVVAITGGVGGAAPKTKVLKKSKADVVESEFMIVKASDGALFTIPTADWFKALLKDICDKSRALEIENPMCFNMDELVPDVAFIIGEDFPETTVDPYDLFNGKPIQ